MKLLHLQIENWNQWQLCWSHFKCMRRRQWISVEEKGVTNLCFQNAWSADAYAHNMDICAIVKCLYSTMYKLLPTTQLKGGTEEKEPQPGARTHGLRSNAEHLWPYIQRLEVKNRGHNGGSHGWNSTLEHRPRVRAPGCGSFSLIATFTLCS